MEEQKTPTPPNPAHTPGTGSGEGKPTEEGKEAGRQDTGTTGEADRAAGKSTGRDSTSLNPSNPVDPESPNLPTP